MSKNSANEIVIIRMYDAPVRNVWDAWVDPKQVAQWWGPRGFTITTRVKDVRPGGVWDYTMHGPDGTDWENVTRFLEVEECALLVYDHGANHQQLPMFRVTARFSSIHNTRTRMELRMALPTPEAATETRKMIKAAGGNSTWDRLGEHLDKAIFGKERFIINRSFDTDIEAMFAMWTDPKHMEQWTPPAGSTMKFSRVDVRVGGEGVYCMQSADGSKMYGKTKYLEINKPNRIVYTQQFCDEQENVARHPMAPTWPETMLTTIELCEEGPRQTRVTVCWEPYDNASAEAVAIFVQSRQGMTQGWTGSLDKLEEHLAGW